MTPYPFGPELPYYAVIFRSRRAPDGLPSYEDAAERMDALARAMPGYLGHHSARGPDGVGITVSYWRTKDDIARWRAHPEHAAVIEAARRGWYDWTVSETALVERASRHP